MCAHPKVELASIAHKMFYADDDVIEAIPYPFMGEGAFRRVLAPCNKHVVKFAINHGGIMSNCREVDIYKEAYKEHKLYLCPVLQHAKGHKWIIQPLCRTIQWGSVQDRKDFDRFERTLKDMKFPYLEDIGMSNVGYLGEQMVVIDYGGVDHF